MRLLSIKLAGFKSFVDPTHLQIPSQLVGIVGPNGCGKSNVIDAVRWVLGESRAAELRGESMQDVIFNGSTQRKPASRASVELVFDNTHGPYLKHSIIQWGQYTEIAVKRVLTRDGISNYTINNLPARRRDIQDIFAGTGLGPRAYAIIGQGMITRMIEAKPDELRVLLEEAAAISKYKERRRETASRLADTRENLTRVDDIVRELSVHLDRLAAQAEIAQHYQALQAESEEKRLLLWLLRKNEAQAEQARQQRALEQTQLELEVQTAQLREIEAELATLRVAHHAASDAVQNAQGALYEANAEVSRLEAEIKFITESRHRVQTQLAALAAQREQWLEQTEHARGELSHAQAALADARKDAAQALDAAATASHALPALEARWRDAQTALNEQRAQITQIEQVIKLETALQRNADQRWQQLQQRCERLQSEARSLPAPDPAQLKQLHAQLAEHETILAAAQAHLAGIEERLPRLDAERRAAQQRRQAESALSQQVEARLAALETLQQNVQTDSRMQPWLERHQLTAQPRLWHKLQVEPGWEVALEAVLRERLAALEVDHLAAVQGWAHDAPPAKLAFYALPLADRPFDTRSELRPLLSLLRIDEPGLRAVLTDWLGLTFVADDLQQALTMREQLPDGGRLVVKAGHQVTIASVQFYAADTEQAGILARQQEIDNLRRQCRAQSLLAEQAQCAALSAEAAHSEVNQSLNMARSEAESARQRVHALQLDTLKLAQAHEQATARSMQIGDELAEIAAQLDEQHALRAVAELKVAGAAEQLTASQACFEDQQGAFGALDQLLHQARQHARELERAAQHAQYVQRDACHRIDELERAMQAAHDQAEHVTAQLEEARSELVSIDQQTTHARLHAALGKRAAKEQALAAARIELDALTAQLRHTDQARLTVERAQQPLRDQLARLQLHEQAARLNCDQYHAQLAEAGVAVEREKTLSAKLTPALKPALLQTEITRLTQAIAALGPINMAALDELATARERKQFLDAQSADLTDAINTLEGAIRRIDQETRALLQSTFDEVNRHLGELFPRLFGGGQAKLVMTGDEILNAGVQVMAQPPGKKNATIHLLSGGEKALTATALVFAIFQLNPAPFCLLDEVDAPLDDANTDRFVKLVRAMAEKTQFLFISHNKVAMEMAQQLIGVTMQEQGVSRIVAVDLEAAARFVQNAA